MSLVFACEPAEAPAPALYAAPTSLDVAHATDGILSVQVVNVGKQTAQILDVHFVELQPGWIALPDIPNTKLSPGQSMHLDLQVDTADADQWDRVQVLTLAVESKSSATSGCGVRAVQHATLEVEVTVFHPRACDRDLDGALVPECGGDDCNDQSASVFPGAPELCDRIDNNCNGVVDGMVPDSDDPDDSEEDPEEVLDGQLWHPDDDQDGFGDPERMQMSCGQPAGWVVDDGDCDDTNGSVRPGATERCNDVDDDCNGLIDDQPFGEPMWYFDADNDGFGDPDLSVPACEAPNRMVANADDCDDDDAAVFPGAVEACDAIDNDCDGQTDEPGSTGEQLWFLDADGDGWGDPNVVASSCVAGSGFIDRAGDCNDAVATVNPEGTEVCNGLDDDCDNRPDLDAIDALTFYADTDGDQFGDASVTETACTPAPGFTDDASDCDDTNAQVNPGAVERCNSLDDDCDTEVDETPFDGTPWYNDADRDGFGNAASVETRCTPGPGQVADGSDCNDGDDEVFPGNLESCDGKDNDCDRLVDEPGSVGEQLWYADGDSDGYGAINTPVRACDAPSGTVSVSGDCDDGNAAVNPDAEEICNDIDDDCDGDIDIDAPNADLWYADADGDTFGDPATEQIACTQPAGTVGNGDDCDDGNGAVNPDATEVCNATDDDCNALIDDDPVDGSTFYVDADADAFGDPTLPTNGCVTTPGLVADNTDCDDDNDQINPGADELCSTVGVDDDCDTEVDEASATDATSWYPDVDLDTFGEVTAPTVQCVAPGADWAAQDGDCDDRNDAVFPGADELCDTIDNDCDGQIDEPPTLGDGTWYADADGDSYGDPNDFIVTCVPPPGYVLNDLDCNDGDPTINPDGTEVCDGFDNDCNGLDDDGATDAVPWWRDADNDGFGDASDEVQECQPPPGYVGDDTDCDDGNDTVFPGAAEVCDSLDNDCNGLEDDDPVDALTWFVDNDRDDYGLDGTEIEACTSPGPDFTSQGGDCDDGSAAVNPGASEVCDGIDNDCNGQIDEAGGSAWYADADGDTFGDPDTSTTACEPPPNYIADNRDCDDGNVLINPAAAEVCDGLDNDCDGAIDINATNGTDYYRDRDGDGFGDATRSTNACTAPPGYVTDRTDCDDTLDSVNPDAPEQCNGIDDNCDGQVDEGSAGDAITWYRDQDGDSFGDPNNTRMSCSQPAGYVADDNDCDDSSALNYPGAPEICDGEDNNCDGVPDDPVPWYRDRDGDNHGDPNVEVFAPTCSPPGPDYVLNNTDCDDTNAAKNPDAAEVCDSLDNDCDNLVDDADPDVTGQPTWHIDRDLDGFGDESSGQKACDAPGANWTPIGEDCDDSSFDVHPGAPEECDSIDNDCNGAIDEGGNCACPIRQFNGHAYAICDFDVPQPFAQFQCGDSGYDLVVINDEQENDWLQQQIQSFGGGNWWIGLSDSNTEGNFTWVDGSPLSYTNWAAGEPNNSGGEDCVEMRSSGQWNDSSCFQFPGKPFICESN